MAETIVGSLMNWLAPREAEATITGAAPTQAMLAAGERVHALQQGQYLPDMQQRIVEAARRHPQAVNLVAFPGLTRRGGITAGFDPATSQILYDPALGGVRMGNTMAHELLHFLNAQTSKQPVETQHALIEKLLGTNAYQPPAQLQGYQPGAFSPVEHSIINEWMGGPRDWPR